MASGQPIQYSDIISPEVQKQLDDLNKTVKSLTEELGKLNKATEKEDATAEDYNDTLRDTVEVTEDLLRLIQDEIVLKKEVEKAERKYKEALEAGSASADKHAMAVKRGKQALSEHGFVLRNAIKLTNATKTSMTELSLELGKNRMAYRKLSEEQRNNDKIGGALLRTIQKQDKAIKKLDAQIGNHQRNVGNYTSALDGLTSTFGGFGLNLRMISNSFRTYVAVTKASSAAMAGMTKSAKVLRVALISTGVGALIVALGTLIGMLTQSNKFTDWFSEKLAYLKGALDGVLDFVGKLGDSLYLLFSGDFSGAWEAAAKAVDGFAEGMDNATKAAIKLYNAEKKLQGLRNAESLIVGSMVRSMAKLQKVWEDDTKSIEEQVKAWNEWQALRLKIADFNILIARKELATLEETDDGYFAAVENVKALEYAKSLLVDETYLDFLFKEQKEIGKIDDSYTQYLIKLKEVNKAEEQLAIDRERRAKVYRAATAVDFGFPDEGYIDDGLNELTDAYLLAADGNEEMTATLISGVNATSNAILGAADQNKQLQTAQALINTFAGVGIALASPGTGYTNLILAGIALATGLANVAKIQNTPAYAEGTEFLEGDSSGTDKIHIRANYGERIVPTDINRRLQGIPNVDLPNMVNAGQLYNNGLIDIARQQLGTQQEMTRTMKRFAYVDKHGNITYLSGDRKNYV